MDKQTIVLFLKDGTKHTLQTEFTGKIKEWLDWLCPDSMFYVKITDTNTIVVKEKDEDQYRL